MGALGIHAGQALPFVLWRMSSGGVPVREPVSLRFLFLKGTVKRVNNLYQFLRVLLFRGFFGQNAPLFSLPQGVPHFLR